MREILFKAQRTDTKDWVEGYICRHPSAIQIGETSPWWIHVPPVDPDDSGGVFNVDPETVGQYTNIDIRCPAWPSSEVHKIFTGDMLGDWGEDEEGNECVCIMGVVTYWESEGRYVLADENGLCNDFTLEDCAQPENWPHLIHCGNIHDRENENEKV